MFQLLECDNLLGDVGPSYSQKQKSLVGPKKKFCQSPRSGTYSNRTLVSIRWTRDMELTCMEAGVGIYVGKGGSTVSRINCGGQTRRKGKADFPFAVTPDLETE
jgi:hypothetical protein